MTEELENRHEPHCVNQLASCTGKEHATHRVFTGKVLYYCNCGYSSGWVDASDMPLPSEFINDHMPPGFSSGVGWTG